MERFRKIGAGMKALFLFFNDSNSKNMILDEISKIEGCRAECVFKPANRFLRIVRRIHICSGLPGIGIWFLDWKKSIKEIQYCICIASVYAPGILKWVRRKNHNVKCINYYWDVVSISGYPVIRSPYFENWSFDSCDCKKFDMKFNPQFFVSGIRLPDEFSVYDIVYVGADRQGRLEGRTRLVRKYFSMFQDLGINVYFYYVTESADVPAQIRKDRLMSEKEYYGVCAKGRAILEIVEPDTRWSTLRPLLALSNHKKVVTNNPEIMNERFYTKDNVFILGVDDATKLKRFVENAFVPIPQGVMEHYSSESWCGRFFER